MIDTIADLNLGDERDLAEALQEQLLPADEVVRSKERVLIYGINYAPDPIGVGRYTGELGDYLVARSVALEVVTAPPHYPGWRLRNRYRNWFAVEREPGVRITRCPLVLRDRMSGIWRLIAPLSFAITSAPIIIWKLVFSRPNSIVCIEPTLFCAPVTLFMAKLFSIRAILYVQDLEVDAAFAVGHLSGGIFKAVAVRIERAILSRFDNVVTISYRMRDRLRQKGVSEMRLIVVRNWVHLDRIKPISGRSKFREEVNVSDETFVVLYSGNVGPKQALHLVLDAAASLIQHPKVAFVVAGDGPEKSKLIEAYGHLLNVHFLPVQPEERLCELLNFADAHVLPQCSGIADLVLPSKLGGMLASDKPCIVMADSGTEMYEFLAGGVVLTPSGDVPALKRAILAVMNKETLFDVHQQRRLARTLSAETSLAALFNVIIDTNPPQQQPAEERAEIKPCARQLDDR